jgi:hypothetical protein
MPRDLLTDAALSRSRRWPSSEARARADIERYLRWSEECQTIAQAAAPEEARRQWHVMADRWIRLAAAVQRDL